MHILKIMKQFLEDLEREGNTVEGRRRHSTGRKRHGPPASLPLGPQQGRAHTETHVCCWEDSWWPHACLKNSRRLLTSKDFRSHDSAQRLHRDSVVPFVPETSQCTSPRKASLPRAGQSGLSPTSAMGQQNRAQKEAGQGLRRPHVSSPETRDLGKPQGPQSTGQVPQGKGHRKPLVLGRGRKPCWTI